MPTERATIAAAWARRRAGGSLRWPTGDRGETWDLPDQDWDRPVPPEVLSRFREAVSEGILAGESGLPLMYRLQAATLGTNLFHDMEIVGRAETRGAFAFAMLAKLKVKRLAEGDRDPRVFRRVGPVACVCCRRLYGTFDAPRVYRLSEVEARGAIEGNYGLAPRRWGVVAGPTHPDDCADALEWYDDHMREDIEAAAREILGFR